MSISTFHILNLLKPISPLPSTRQKALTRAEQSVKKFQEVRDYVLSKQRWVTSKEVFDECDSSIRFVRETLITLCDQKVLMREEVISKRGGKVSVKEYRYKRYDI